MERPRRTTSPGSRRLGRGGSSSTGMLTYASSFDPYPGPSRSSVGFTSGPRTSTERVGGSRVVPRYRHESPPRQPSGDDFVVRPRRPTLDVPELAPRRPLSYITPTSPNRPRPIVTSAVDNAPGPLPVAGRSRREEDHYIQPASSSSRRDHRRNYTYGSIDTSRIGIGEREARDRWDYGVYSRPGSIRGIYNSDTPHYYRPYHFDERDPGYEYTDRREQVYRDIEPRPRVRRDSNAGRPERPVSMAGLDDYPPRINLSSRESGPPVSMDTRGYTAGGRANLGRSGSLTHGHRRPESELPREYLRDEYDTSQPRKSTSSRGPIVHQDYPEDYPTHRKEAREPAEAWSRKHDGPSLQEPRTETGRNEHLDEQYGRSSDDRSTRYHDRGHHRGHERDDRDHRGDHEREDRDHHRGHERSNRDHRSREEERLHGQEVSANGLIASAAASAAGAGVAAESSRRRHHRRDRNKDDGDAGKGRAREDHHGHRTKREDSQKDNYGSGSSVSSSDGSDGEGQDRRERHRRQPEPREEKEGKESRKDVEPIAPLKEGVVHEEPSRDNAAVNEVARIEEAPRSTPRHRRHHSHTHEKDSYSDDSSGSSRRSEIREKKPAPAPGLRQVRVVTPAEEAEPRDAEAPIRGILRTPRERFPEDPAPVREGVAPQKDAGPKKGIPAGARWTKIDRKLVNPEALLAGNERFEERPDHVIVLRVLAKEDIQAYALKTQEIRAKRAAGDRGVDRGGIGSGGGSGSGSGSGSGGGSGSGSGGGVGGGADHSAV